MSEEFLERPRPFPVNKATVKVLDSHLAPDETRHTNVYEFKRFDSTNYNLLLERDKAIHRLSESLPKNKSREKTTGVDDANESFFDSLVVSGYHEFEGEKDEFTVEDLRELVPERKAAGIARLLECKARVIKIVGVGKNDYMFERPGHMMVELLIGDYERPTYKLLLKYVRPKKGKRSKFREDFGYNIVNRGGDMPITESHVDLASAIRMSDEYFETVIMDDPGYSEVHFLNTDGTALDHKFGEQETDKNQFLALINPQYKVELATTLVTSFSKSDRE